jgi:hypothetical protein
MFYIYIILYTWPFYFIDPLLWQWVTRMRVIYEWGSDEMVRIRIYRRVWMGLYKLLVFPVGWRTCWKISRVQGLTLTVARLPACPGQLKIILWLRWFLVVCIFFRVCSYKRYLRVTKNCRTTIFFRKITQNGYICNWSARCVLFSRRAS